ncbi:hypothetical protein ACEQ8H_004305 [Pleosporales sp. CAS-2024a]
MASRKKPLMISKSTKGSTSGNGSANTIPRPAEPTVTCLPPIGRIHHASYHYPLLIDDKSACDALLNWFKACEETRNMPWRKAWIDPSVFDGTTEEFQKALGIRAYEVWVSEIMLQQTRVSTVIPYFNNWIAKWPTVQDLADAHHEDVLACWRGLGYYSRATRLHEGAKAMIEKAAGATCPLPSKAADLLCFPGIGRYTAGAVSSIAFGEPEPVLDGNVIRVLSRQLGLYMDGKDKKATDVLWGEADRLVKHVAKLSGIHVSAVPGQWNQALMELGSTVCTPKPQCADCPIQTTCRAYNEGQALVTHGASPTVVTDIEEICTLCDALDPDDLALIAEDTKETETPKPVKKRKGNIKQSNKISQYFSTGNSDQASATKEEEEDDAGKTVDATIPQDSKKRKARPSDSVPAAHLKIITTYCSLFPKKVEKKKATEEECVVCVIELEPTNGESRWLIEQRPAKGLLASLWQFPQSTLTAPTTTTDARKAWAEKYMKTLSLGKVDAREAVHVAAFPALVHVFTHIRLTMHVHHFRIPWDDIEDMAADEVGPPARRWVETGSMDEQTLSTGMRKCWELIAK